MADLTFYLRLVYGILVFFSVYRNYNIKRTNVINSFILSFFCANYANLSELKYLFYEFSNLFNFYTLHRMFIIFNLYFVYCIYFVLIFHL